MVSVVFEGGIEGFGSERVIALSEYEVGSAPRLQRFLQEIELGPDVFNFVWVN